MGGLKGWKRTSRMEQRDSKPQHLLHRQLRPMHKRMSRPIELIIQVVLPETQTRHQIRPAPDRELHESLPSLQHQSQRPRLGIQGLPRAANDDGDGAAHTLVIGSAVGEEVLAGLAGDGGEAHAESVVAVQRNAEIGIEGQEGIGDAREELGEPQGFGGESCESAVRDDAVGVVAEDVLAGWFQFLRAMESCGEVSGEETPDFTAAQPVASLREFSVD